MYKSILITGGCGFVGSRLALMFKERYADAKVTAFDNLKRRGSELNLPALKAAGIDFIHGDIRVPSDLNECGPCDLVIDAAAEPSVLAGLNGSPDYLIQTNLNGTLYLLEYARLHKAAFLFLSTSRVYPIQPIMEAEITEAETRFLISDIQKVAGLSSKGISEAFPLEGSRSLYGASKLASELFVQEYVANFGLKAVINRCGVITGPGQMGKVDQGVVVLWLARHYWQGKLGYFGFGGTGKQVRDILHVNDLFSLLAYQAEHMDQVSGKVYNAGGGADISVSLAELTTICEKVTGNSIEITRVVENRAADIPFYITDNSKVTSDTGWYPKMKPEEIMKDIYLWMQENENLLKPILQ